MIAIELAVSTTRKPTESHPHRERRGLPSHHVVKDQHEAYEEAVDELRNTDGKHHV
jgi:hypothetical protein